MKRKYKKEPSLSSPCISVCAMDEETGYCRGCFRTLREITEWENYDNARKQQIIDSLPFRHPD